MSDILDVRQIFSKSAIFSGYSISEYNFSCNCNILLYSRNYCIEIQFHTQESFDVKMSEEDHKLYEQRRVLEPGCDEYNRILQLQLKLYSDMEYPENIADLEKI